MHFIGIDVHKKQSQICILDEKGEVVYETRVPTSRADLADVLRSYPGSRVVIEACTPSEWVARHLESLSLEVIVADPSFAPMYATRSKKLKTDKRDARALAQACKLGAYRPAHRMSDAQRDIRIQIDVRKTLVELRTRLTNQIGAVVLAYGYRVGTGAAEHFLRRLEQVDLPPSLRVQLEPLVAMLRPLNERIEELDEQLTQKAKADAQVTRLRAICGVGPLTALLFVAVVDGAQRFEGAHQLMSYLGLVPREYSSGEKQQRGRITKSGHRRIRSHLVQAALVLLRSKKPEMEPLRNWATGIAQRRGKKIAAVALARRLAGIMWAMLRDGSEYRGKSDQGSGPRNATKDVVPLRPDAPSLAA